MPCVKCGSEVQVEGVRILDRVSNLSMALALTVQVDRNPDALLFRGAVTNTVAARVCGGCGFLELYVEHPKGLVRAAADRDRKHPPRKRAGG